MRRICVFCGSSRGASPEYARVAREMGCLLVAMGVGLVYGGASGGLMGSVADAVLAEGGEAVGVLPRVLEGKEIPHPGLTALHRVGSMHERKALMADLSDGFIALPGGLGTLEEFFEVLTWAQLGMHTKPCGLLNVGGYYDRLIAFLDHAQAEQFVRERQRSLLLVAETPSELLGKFAGFVAPVVDRVLDARSI